VRRGGGEREREEWDTGVKMFIEGQHAERECNDSIQKEKSIVN
jgi:hypothetical protein